MMTRKTLLTLMLCLSMLTATARDYNIVAYGAKADTTVLSTKALQEAIDDCSKAGGGRVVVPTGQYKIGSVVLKSDVHLYLEQGATLYGSTNLDDYKPMKSDYVSLRTQTSTIQLIYADKVRNVVIDGFDNVEVKTEAPDIRPDFVNDDTEGWGDQGDGTYRNPVLNADFSDPDVIRVGEKYYMVASDFHFLGMQVMESDDMVNWRYISQIYRRFDEPGWDGNNHYAGGSWAPAIRYHNGLYYVYFCTPEEGLFMSTAKDPHGPWAPLHLVKRVPKWEDPCPFWDEDGQAYLGRSKHGAGPIIVHKMSADGKQLLDEGTTVAQRLVLPHHP